jgi:hypothetical protein
MDLILILLMILMIKLPLVLLWPVVLLLLERLMTPLTPHVIP